MIVIALSTAEKERLFPELYSHKVDIGLTPSGQFILLVLRSGIVSVRDARSDNGWRWRWSEEHQNACLVWL